MQSFIAYISFRWFNISTPSRVITSLILVVICHQVNLSQYRWLYALSLATYPPNLSLLITITLENVSINPCLFVCFVLFVDSPYKWNRMVFVFLHLIYFTGIENLHLLTNMWNVSQGAVLKGINNKKAILLISHQCISPHLIRVVLTF